LVLEQIQSGRLTPSLKTNREHVRHVKKLVAEKENSNADACPICGSEMVLRETKKGDNLGKQFWGCSAFPKCRGTRTV
jgi:ssDNA-binding Zn-finger/Zn-ribbon topoisomerase 1